MAQALRRKMFKMGGEVSKSHGVGITSGLSYNKGGPVVKPGPDGKPRQHAFLGGLMTIGNMLRAGATLRNPVTPLMNYLRFGTSSAKELDKLRRGAATTLRKTMKDKDITRDVIDASMKGGRFKQGLRALDLVGQGSIPLGVASFLYGPRMTEKERKEATDFQRGLDTARYAVETLPSFSGLGAGVELAGLGASTIYESMQEDPNYQLLNIPDLVRKYTTGLPEEPTIDISDTGAGVKDLEPADISAKIAELNKKQLEDDIAMYRSIMAQGDDTDKLAVLGSALTQGGAALLSGQGYGAAASAFNEPLDTARLTKEERERAITSGAAEYALGNYATERALEDATLAELIKTGDLASAEQVQRYTLANKLSGGFVPILPESLKDLGVLDSDKLTVGTVYQNPKGLTKDDGTPIRGIFVAVNKKGTEAAGFDSIEEAQVFAQSE